MDDRGIVQPRNDGLSAAMYLVAPILDLLGETLKLPDLWNTTARKPLLLVT